MIRIAVMGYGYWGPNIVRNFSRLPGVQVGLVCDLNPRALEEVRSMHPSVAVTQNPQDIWNDKSIDAVVIVTPTATHFPLAKTAMESGKHVLLEKPMTPDYRQAQELVRIAKRKKRVLMVDFTFIYTPAIEKIKSIIDRGQLGDIYYVDSVRTNLGILQKDSNVIYDLATHDFSIMDYLFGASPVSVSATGIMHKELRQETVAHIAVTYPDIFLHCHVSWLSPVKIRRMIFVGTKKMLTFDDIEPSEKIKIYDKGVSFVKDPKQSYQLRIGYRTGDVTVPHIPIEEGLSGMAKEFIRAVRTGSVPRTDGRMGMRVVNCLEKATASLRKNGRPVRL